MSWQAFGECCEGGSYGLNVALSPSSPSFYIIYRGNCGRGSGLAIHHMSQTFGWA